MEEKDGEHVVDARGENRRNQREIAGERYVAVVGQREQQGRSQRRWRRLLHLARPCSFGSFAVVLASGQYDSVELDYSAVVVVAYLGC